jgi:transposase
MMYSEREWRKVMSDKKYRVYTEEFKLEALALLKSSGKSAQQIERDLGVTAGMLLKWQNRYQVVTPKGQEPKLEPSDLEAAKREIQRLQREIMEIAEEREILKKAVNIFSRKSA